MHISRMVDFNFRNIYLYLILTFSFSFCVKFCSGKYIFFFHKFEANLKFEVAMSVSAFTVKIMFKTHNIFL